MMTSLTLPLANTIASGGTLQDSWPCGSGKLTSDDEPAFDLNEKYREMDMSSPHARISRIRKALTSIFKYLFILKALIISYFAWWLYFERFKFGDLTLIRQIRQSFRFYGIVCVAMHVLLSDEFIST